MKTLEKRLFHLFEPADVARAREITLAKVSCPRVGQVRAMVSVGDGEDHEVFLELSAHRRGGMTLESRCSTIAGRAGRPCAIPTTADPTMKATDIQSITVRWPLRSPSVPARKTTRSDAIGGIDKAMLA